MSQAVVHHCGAEKAAEFVKKMKGEGKSVFVITIRDDYAGVPVLGLPKDEHISLVSHFSISNASYSFDKDAVKSAFAAFKDKLETVDAIVVHCGEGRMRSPSVLEAFSQHLFETFDIGIAPTSLEQSLADRDLRYMVPQIDKRIYRSVLSQLTEIF